MLFFNSFISTLLLSSLTTNFKTTYAAAINSAAVAKDALPQSSQNSTIQLSFMIPDDNENSDVVLDKRRGGGHSSSGHSSSGRSSSGHYSSSGSHSSSGRSGKICGSGNGRYYCGSGLLLAGSGYAAGHHYSNGHRNGTNTSSTSSASSTSSSTSGSGCSVTKISLSSSLLLIILVNGLFSL